MTDEQRSLDDIYDDLKQLKALFEDRSRDPVDYGALMGRFCSIVECQLDLTEYMIELKREIEETRDSLGPPGFLDPPPLSSN